MENAISLIRIRVCGMSRFRTGQLGEAFYIRERLSRIVMLLDSSIADGGSPNSSGDK